MPERATLEEAFRAVRAELGIRTEFPPDVSRAAEMVSDREGKEWWGGREDLTAIPFVTIDPPGSRDLDQALYIESLSGNRLRVRYAIADVACFVDRGGVIEEEAWKRGVTFYSPDQRDSLYPEALSQGAASLLPDQLRPAIVFTLDVDEAGKLVDGRVRRARVRSRGQLTYEQALEHDRSGGKLLGDEPFSESLLLLREVGERRAERERRRGGMSLPILDQQVQKRTARRLGYELAYEEPNVAEDWNAQVSLLTGHAAARWMLRAEVGVLRVMPPPRDTDVARLRVAARALGFRWPREVSYVDFIRSLAPDRPHLDVLIWQTRHLMRGADYVAFDGTIPEHVEHAALAMPYAHCTAPLRRLADRYVLDLLIELADGATPRRDEIETLCRLPKIMNAADTKSARLERKVVDVAEAWELRDRVGDTFTALVLDVTSDRIEGQLVGLPIRARIPIRDGAPALELGADVKVRLADVNVEKGIAEFELAGPVR